MAKIKRNTIWIFRISILCSLILIIYTIFIDYQVGREGVVWEFPIIPHPQEIFLSTENQYFVIDQKTKILLEDLSAKSDSTSVNFIFDILRKHGLKRLKVAPVRNVMDFSNSTLVDFWETATGDDLTGGLLVMVYVLQRLQRSLFPNFAQSAKTE